MLQPHSAHGFQHLKKRPFRVIHSLLLEFAENRELIIQLDNDGRCKLESPPFSHDKVREIDLRVGDVLKIGDEFRTIETIQAYRENFYQEKPEKWDGFLVESQNR